MEWVQNITLQNWCQIYTVWYVLCCLWSTKVNKRNTIWENLGEGFIMSVMFPLVSVTILGVAALFINVIIFAVTGISVL